MNSTQGFEIAVIAMLLSLCLASLVPHCAHGQVYSAEVVYMRGAHGISSEQARSVYREAVRRISEETGKTLVLRKWKVRSFNLALTFLNRADVLNRVRGYFTRRKSNDWIQIAIMGPLVQDGVWYSAGLATGTCMRGYYSPLAVVNVTESNDLGAYRLPHAITSIEHETGHLMGAEHDNSTNRYGEASVMNGNALAYVEAQKGRLFFSAKSVRQIRGCWR